MGSTLKGILYILQQKHMENEAAATLQEDNIVAWREHNVFFNTFVQQYFLTIKHIHPQTSNGNTI